MTISLVPGRTGRNHGVVPVDGATGFGQEMVIQILAKWCVVGVGRVYAWVARVKNRGKLFWERVYAIRGDPMCWQQP